MTDFTWFSSSVTASANLVKLETDSGRSSSGALAPQSALLVVVSAASEAAAVVELIFIFLANPCAAGEVGGLWASLMEFWRFGMKIDGEVGASVDGEER